MDGKRKTAVVIGGGAAGMMAAAALKELCGGVEVILLERNDRLGSKVLLSGGGRCNVTTGMRDARKVLENYPRGARFLMSAMFRFPPEKVMEWFEARGVRLKVEDDMRVFPVSDDGSQVVEALEKSLRGCGAKIFLKTAVLGAGRKGKGFVLETGAGSIQADFLIITTGGSVYKKTGSRGDGYAFARALGHTVTPLAPSLGAFLAAEDWVADAAGVSVNKAGLVLGSGEGGGSYKRTGPMLFTHHGVSGPAVFALSSMSAYEPCSKEKPMTLSVNFFPGEDGTALGRRLQKTIEQNGKKHAVNLMDMFLPKGLCAAVVRQARVNGDARAGSLSKEQRKALVAAMTEFTLKLAGRGTGEEFVTAGGVSLAEVNSSTMESKLCPGLYFAGEVLDVDGFTGGFNLQAAWATGRLAGESVAKNAGSCD